MRPGPSYYRADGPVCGGPGMGWGGVISIFILISILILIFISLFIWIGNICVYNPLASPSRRRPQALFFFEKRHAFLQKGPFLTKALIVCNIYSFYLFSKTPNRRGTHSYAEKWSNFVLSFHIDPIGNRNDV